MFYLSINILSSINYYILGNGSNTETAPGWPRLLITCRDCVKAFGEENSHLSVTFAIMSNNQVML